MTEARGADGQIDGQSSDHHTGPATEFPKGTVLQQRCLRATREG